MTKQRFKDTKPTRRSYKTEKVRQYNDQRKKDKQCSIKHYTIQIDLQETHKKRKN